MEIDEGRSALNSLVEHFNHLKLSDANEAETRKKVIDVIIEKVLGWSTDDVAYETRVTEDGKAEFADYKLTTATTGIVIEAKKVGTAFNLPHNRTAMILGGVLSEGAIGEAIRQVRDYARKLSIPYAIATNGNSWLVFPAVRTDGVKFEETQARIFRSLEDIKYRFVEFWELISRQRVIEGGLENEMFGPSKINFPNRLILKFDEPGYRLGRNRVYEYIEPAVNLALTDESLLKDNEALEACYVISSERRKYDSRLQMYLKDLKPYIERKVIRVRKSKNVKVFDETIEKSFRLTKQFLLLLGPVGAGKTTFLHYTRYLSAAPLINSKIMWFYLDFRKTTESTTPKDFIYSELLNLIETDDQFELGSWDNSIKHSYKEDINILKKGPLKPVYEKDHVEFDRIIAGMIYKERENIIPYVQKIIKNATIFRPGYLIIDNVDQIENEAYQNKIFTEAQAAARLMNLNVIMSIRESTYLKHRNTPVFDAFQIDAIYIDPPQIMPVLSRRFAYAKRVLKGQTAEIISETGKRFIVPDLSVFFEIVAKSLLVGETGYMLEVMAGDDVRRGLNLVREFLASGHVSADHILFVYVTKGEDRIFPPHEVFKGIILGQRQHYREEESLLINVYDSKLGTQLLQLLRFRILRKLMSLVSMPTFDGILVENVKSDLYRIGVSVSDMEKCISDLYSNRLIRTIDGMPVKGDSKIFPTRFGGYLCRELATQFSYIEPCLIDAAIYNDETWQQLQDMTTHIEQVSKNERIPLRINRAKIFLDYIRLIDGNWVNKCKRYNLTNGWESELIDSTVFDKIKSNFDYVITMAEKVKTMKAK